MKILFVCTGNSFRSPVAEALLKKFRKDITVDSAGISPAGWIANGAKNFLEKENAAAFLKERPEAVELKNLEEFDLIVVMEEEHKRNMVARWPQLEGKIEVWNVEDPYFLPRGSAQKIFEEIKREVQKLAEKL